MLHKDKPPIPTSDKKTSKEQPRKSGGIEGTTFEEQEKSILPPKEPPPNLLGPKDSKEPSKDKKPAPTSGLLVELEKITFLRGKLDGKHGTLDQGFTVRESMNRQLEILKKRFNAGDTALGRATMLATAISECARILAAEQNDPLLVPLFTRKLFEHYGREITTAVRSDNANQKHKGNSARVMRLAAAIGSDDPVGLYMKEKIRLEDCVLRVRAMAERGKIKPSAMFKALSQRFQASMGSLSLGEVAKGEKTVDPGKDSEGRAIKFHLGELYGEISKKYFQSVVDDGKEGTAKFDEEGLVMTTQARQKLEEVGKLVAAWDKSEAPSRTPPPSESEEEESQDNPVQEGKKLGFFAKQRKKKREKRHTRAKTRHESGLKDNLTKAVSDRETRLEEGKGRGTRANDYVPAPGMGPLSEKQYNYIRGVIRDDQEGKDEALDNTTQVFMKRYGLTQPQAEKTIDNCIRWLADVPVTITFPAASLFKGGPVPSKGTTYTNVAQNTAKQKDLGSMLGPRGKRDTDQVTTYDVDGAWRGPNYMRWRRDKDENQTGQRGLSRDEMASFGALNINYETTGGGGENYYGKCHFVLNDEVKARSTYSFGTDTPERRDFGRLLGDIASKPGKVATLDTIVNNCHKLGQAYLAYRSKLDLQTELEVHIYGALDIAKDVKAISMPMDFDVELTRHMTEFASDNGIEIRKYDPGAIPEMSQDDKALGASLRRELAKKKKGGR